MGAGGPPGRSGKQESAPAGQAGRTVLSHSRLPGGAESAGEVLSQEGWWAGTSAPAGWRQRASRDTESDLNGSVAAAGRMDFWSSTGHSESIGGSAREATCANRQ